MTGLNVMEFPEPPCCLASGRLLWPLHPTLQWAHPVCYALRSQHCTYGNFPGKLTWLVGKTPHPCWRWISKQKKQVYFPAIGILVFRGVQYHPWQRECWGGCIGHVHLRGETSLHKKLLSNIATVDGSEIWRSQVEVGSWNPVDLQGLGDIPGGWPWDVWTINSHRITVVWVFSFSFSPQPSHPNHDAIFNVGRLAFKILRFFV